ncbi:hypothetical protein HPB50_028899 [Hyalomma asiaticum]|nr:hypothetical protein HPB50_028899 [Hyalomma asiaticum]
MKHLVQNFADARRYDDVQDPRLEWLEVTFPMYLDGLKKRCNHRQEFLTKETYEAILVTTYSTVACTRYLLTEENFLFVLTRRFNSDPIESLFGTLRMSSGTNDMLDVRAALSGLEKILKTGIAAANVASNVAHAENVTSAPLPGSASSSQPASTSSALVSSAANTDVQTPPSLKKAVVVLQRLITSVLPQYLPSLQISATVCSSSSSNIMRNSNHPGSRELDSRATSKKNVHSTPPRWEAPCSVSFFRLPRNPRRRLRCHEI